MQFVDRSFAISAVMFGVGAATGFLVAGLFPGLRGATVALLQVRVLGPLHSAMMIGNVAVVVLIFANNAVPVLLSFLYPVLLARVTWTPPLTKGRRQLLLTGYTLLAAFLLGFLDLGATLGSILFERGAAFVGSLLTHSWLHGPIEFAFILLSISEPARVALRQGRSSFVPYERKDRVLLLSCLVGLLVSAMLEFALNV